jgi:hypothetical protein
VTPSESASWHSRPAAKKIRAALKKGREGKGYRGNTVGKLIDQAKFARAVEHFRLAVESSKQHSALAASALKKYGSHGPDISGVVRDHFPANVKTDLRLLARNVTEQRDAAWAARPRGVRASTMRRLGTEVADRYGSGFYGPQPSRKGNPMKKRRSAKQMAAFKKMRAGLLRWKKSTKHPRKHYVSGKRKKRNPVAREAYRREHRYQIAALSARGNHLVFFNGQGFGTSRAQAASYGDATTAKYVAMRTRKRCAVVGENEGAPTVRAFLEGKA